jgi:phosphopantetheine adenylyltransferase
MRKMGIKHLKDLSDEEFEKLVSSKISLTYKIDGSANIGFGKDDNGNIYVARMVKNQPTKIYSENEWPKNSMYNSLRAASAVIFNNTSILKSKLKVGDYINAEILFEDIPNVIFYGGGNHIVMHDDQFPFLEGEILKSNVDLYFYDDQSGTIIKTNSRVSFGIRGPTAVHAVLDARTRETLYDSIAPYLECYGHPTLPYCHNWEHEGIVLDGGGVLAKVVTNFKEVNRHFWYYREMMEQGSGLKGSFKPGVMTKYKNSIADLFDIPVAKTPGFKSYLTKKYPNMSRYNQIISLFNDKSVDFNKSFIKEYCEILNQATCSLDELIVSFEENSGKNAVSLVGGKERAWDHINIRKTRETYLRQKNYFSGIQSQVKLLQYRDQVDKLVKLMLIFINEYEEAKMGFYDNVSKKLFGKKVGVVLGRFQPPTTGHMTNIKKAMCENDIVLIFVGGNKPDVKNPIPYNIRKGVLHKYIEEAIEVSDQPYKQFVEDYGKMTIAIVGQYARRADELREQIIKHNNYRILPLSTGFIPELIKDNIDVNSISHINIYCGDDREDTYTKQMKNYWEDDITWNIITTKRDSISGTMARDLIYNPASYRTRKYEESNIDGDYVLHSDISFFSITQEGRSWNDDERDEFLKKMFKLYRHYIKEQYVGKN